VADKFIDPSRIEAAATCATAGIIVGVVTLTGLGLKFSIIILSLAGSNLFLTMAYKLQHVQQESFVPLITQEILSDSNRERVTGNEERPTTPSSVRGVATPTPRMPPAPSALPQTTAKTLLNSKIKVDNAGKAADVQRSKRLDHERQLGPCPSFSSHHQGETDREETWLKIRRV